MPMLEYSARAGEFSGRTNKQTEGVRSSKSRQRSRMRSLRVPLLSRLRVDPHLLELNRGGRPRRRLRLEEDHVVLEPDPRAAVLDLRARSPAEAVGVARERIHAELFLVRQRARRQEAIEVGRRGWSQPALAGLRRLFEREHGLPGAILARHAEAPLRRRPQLTDRALLADDHPRARAFDAPGEAIAPLPRGHDVRTEVAERGETVVTGDGDEPPEPATGHVLEEDALDRLACAERQDLLEPRFQELSHR